MNKRLGMILLVGLSVLLFVSCNNIKTNNEELKKKVLFDNAHAQTSGKNNWTIRGGFLDFAGDLKKNGFGIYEWGDDEVKKDKINPIKEDDGPITLEILKRFNVYIIPEPNAVFTKDEQKAILRFIEDGGSVFFIADQTGTDRNRNGWETVEIFNGFKKDNITIESTETYKNDFVGKLGFRFREKSYSEIPVKNIKQHQITDGVTKTAVWNGTTTYVFGNNISGLIYLEDESNGPFMIAGTYGKGKFVAIGDTAPFNTKMRDIEVKINVPVSGYHTFDDAKLACNIINWLSK